MLNKSFSKEDIIKILFSNGTGYTKNHQRSLNGKTNNFTLNDILQLAKKHSIKDNIAKEYEEFCKAIEEHLSVEQMREILDMNDKDSSSGSTSSSPLCHPI